MELPEAYYLPVGDDTFESSAATTSPWDLAAQPGGPPSALLARAVDGTTADPAFTIARLTVDRMDAATDLSPHGRGVAHATMSDRDGVLAHVAQPLLVSRR